MLSNRKCVSYLRDADIRPTGFIAKYYYFSKTGMPWFKKIQPTRTGVINSIRVLVLLTLLIEICFIEILIPVSSSQWADESRIIFDFKNSNFGLFHIDFGKPNPSIFDVPYW